MLFCYYYCSYWPIKETSWKYFDIFLIYLMSTPLWEPKIKLAPRTLTRVNTVTALINGYWNVALYYIDQLLEKFIVYGLWFLSSMINSLWWFMVAYGSNLWYMPTWELVPKTTRTDQGTITCKWYIQFIYYLFLLKFTVYYLFSFWYIRYLMGGQPWVEWNPI